MGDFPDPDSGCRRHPTHKQLPGVCSVCLSERLLRLTTAVDDSNYTTACYSSLSSSQPYSSSSSFSPAVAPNEVEKKQTSAWRPYRRRNGSNDHVDVSLGFLLNEGNGDGDLGLKKSRSVGCGPRIYRGVNGNFNGDGDGEGGKKREKKGSVGFWKKVIHSMSKKMKGFFMHSSTMKVSSDHTSSSSSRKLR